ncbi:ABC transporter substrate-binding protein [Pseudonocardia sp. WMMC193]|uniref:ABC transporter substrate-binding protein n=1 Tax=Pseudonocardia sp. WMMC193 TaxID=2911965 RepID=UPI001F316833|nr:ABC transporter substrate-binding protein [Pseudonocardia sp. WMMC193]MCF7553604.1 ABC transporter substrate-binding protein [Pseudonocardia sp. WMMC193]
MTIRRKGALAILAAALTLAIAACGGGGQSAAGGDGSGPITIGAWIPLSGAQAASGVPQMEGAKAYFSWLNDNGGINGRQVNWIVKDNAYDPQQTVQAARALVGQDGVVAIVNANGVAPSEAAFPFVLDQSKIPIVDHYGGVATWYDPARPLLFGTQTLYEDQAAAMAQWAVESGARKLVVVHDDPKAFADVAAQIGPAAARTDAAATTTAVPVKLGTTDFAPAVSQVKALGGDAVMLILPAPEAAAYLKAAQLQGVTLPAYGYAPLASNTVVTLAGSAAENFRAVSLVRAPSDPGPAMAQFREVMAKYAPGQPADYSTLLGYANAAVFAEVAKTIQGPVTAESIAEAYRNATAVETGVAPTMSFSADRHVGTRDVQRVTVQGGQWTAVGDFVSAPDRG